MRLRNDIFSNKKNENLTADIGISGYIVITLLEPYLGKGHSLYLDKWCTSPALFSYLHENKTNACGTVKINRKNMSPLSKMLEWGQVECMSTDILLALKWKVKKNFRMLSTFHTDVQSPTGNIDRNTQEEIRKPAIIMKIWVRWIEVIGYWVLWNVFANRSNGIKICVFTWWIYHY